MATCFRTTGACFAPEPCGRNIGFGLTHGLFQSPPSEHNDSGGALGWKHSTPTGRKTSCQKICPAATPAQTALGQSTGREPNGIVAG